MNIEYSPIGTIRSPFAQPTDMPIQPTGAIGIQGTIEVLDEFRAGLKDLDGFSHLILLYHFHQSSGFNLHPVPFWIVNRADCLRPENRSIRFRSACPSCDWTRSRLVCGTSRTWIFSTEPRSWTSSPTCRHSTRQKTCAPAGSRTRPRRSPTTDRMIGFSRARGPGSSSRAHYTRSVF